MFSNTVLITDDMKHSAKLELGETLVGTAVVVEHFLVTWAIGALFGVVQC